MHHNNLHEEEEKEEGEGEEGLELGTVKKDGFVEEKIEENELELSASEKESEALEGVFSGICVQYNLRDIVTIELYT